MSGANTSALDATLLLRSIPFLAQEHVSVHFATSHTSLMKPFFSTASGPSWHCSCGPKSGQEKGAYFVGNQKILLIAA
jgi:hypothetical protein